MNGAQNEITARYARSLSSPTDVVAGPVHRSDHGAADGRPFACRHSFVFLKGTCPDADPSIMRRALVFQVATIVALLGASFIAAFFTHAVVQAEIHRQRAGAADRLSLEINTRISKGLAAENAVFHCSRFPWTPDKRT